MHSAVKIDGERAYRRARRGEQFELPERIVTVYRFEQLWHTGERAGYEIECGAGTYVRSLIADLNDAYCLQLRRTAIGPFEVADAVAPPARDVPWGDPPLIALERALTMLEHNGRRPRSDCPDRDRPQSANTHRSQ